MSEVGLSMSEEAVRRRQRRRTGGSVLVAVLLLAGLLGTGFVGARGVLGRFVGGETEAVANYPGPGERDILFQVRPGETATDIGERLAKADVVKSPKAFIEAAAADAEQASTLQPGFYRLRTKMTGSGAFALLLDPAARAEARVTVPEGLRLEETLKTLSKGTGIPVADFTKAIKAGNIGLPPYAQGKPEGYLFPATYEVPPGAKAADVLRLMTARFSRAAQKIDIDGHPTLRAEELVIIASLVEAEADGPADFGKVSRVVHNRLAEPMRLGFDSTVNYALKADKKFVTNDDLRVDSDYNTYRNDGLPPGPIGSPGEKALAAAKNPEPGPWLYFITTDINTGKTEFTESYRKFLNLKNECKNRNAC